MRLASLLVFFAAGLIGLAGTADADPFKAMTVDRVEPPVAAPDVAFKSLEGGDVRVRDLRGKVVLLGFFTTDWPNCRREAPARAKLYEEFKRKGLEMVGIGLRERAESVKEFAREFDIRFHLWIDPTGRSPAAFGVWAHPNTILIDRQGRIVGRVRGERNWMTDDARRLVELLLKGQ